LLSKLGNRQSKAFTELSVNTKGNNMEYFLAFYLAGIVLAMFKLYMPCYKLIKEVNPRNPVIVHKYIAFVVMVLGFMIILIPLTPALLSDKLAKAFCVSFVDAVLEA